MCKQSLQDSAINANNVDFREVFVGHHPTSRDCLITLRTMKSVNMVLIKVFTNVTITCKTTTTTFLQQSFILTGILRSCTFHYFTGERDF